jgi:hypothetical protein
MFQVVDLGEGVRQYRTMDRRTMPPDFSLDDAIRLAMVDECKRRAQRPPKPQRPPRRHYEQIAPMHVPPSRGYERPPASAAPMRRLLCDKLRQRVEKRMVAA